MRSRSSFQKQCVFLDRDGVICKEKKPPYVRTPDEFIFIPGCGKAISLLKQIGFYVIVITNQSGINRGIVKKENFKAIQKMMIETLKKKNAGLDAVYVCPHTPDEKCACRKPLPGNILKAVRKFGIDLAGSYFVGDTLTDMQAGKAAGCKTVLVMSGKGKKELKKLRTQKSMDGMKPDFTAKDLLDAARKIAGAGGSVQGAGKKG